MVKLIIEIALDKILVPEYLEVLKGDSKHYGFSVTKITHLPSAGPSD